MGGSGGSTTIIPDVVQKEMICIYRLQERKNVITVQDNELLH
jgi:hypothetical protein